MKKMLFATFLLIACPILSLAKSDGAILAAAERVQVNGQQAARSSTVFPGDRVQTAQKGYALLRSSDSLVSVGVDSSIKYDGASVTLERGVAIVTASKGMVAHFENLVITADSGRTSKFSLISANGLKRIAVLEGSLQVSDGTHLANLKAGEMMVPVPADGPGVAGHIAVAPGWGLPGWAIEAVIGVTAAATTVGVLAATGVIFGSRLSPSKP